MKPFPALFPESKFDDSFGVSSAAEPLSNGPVGMSSPVPESSVGYLMGWLRFVVGRSESVTVSIMVKPSLS
jgi:hypothetical protein